MRTNLIHFTIVWLLPCLLVFSVPCLLVCRADFDEVIDSPMYRLPTFLTRLWKIDSRKQREALWLRRSQRPEVDMKCRAAHAIAEAHAAVSRGWRRPSTLFSRNSIRRTRLRRASACRPGSSRVKRASAQAIFCGARQTGDNDLRGSIEPALALGLSPRLRRVTQWPRASRPRFLATSSWPSGG